MSLVDVYLGLGSNIEREKHLTAGLDALSQLLGDISVILCLKASLGDSR